MSTTVAFSKTASILKYYARCSVISHNSKTHSTDADHAAILSEQNTGNTGAAGGGGGKLSSSPMIKKTICKEQAGSRV
jgi:hypothetical protein